ncbi:MAG TPA: DUF1801 domain-containing protein [Acidimicrobiia bacterium]|nr:DUF1801 domain-containing protein [Acidimicrobiia bacterium]
MKNPDVDAWFGKKQHPMEEAMQKVREVTLAADDRITESIKWSTPTFSYRGNIFSFNPAKKFVSLLFHTGAHLPGDWPGLEGEGETARVMRFADAAEVEARKDELTAILRAWCDWKDG